MGGTIMAIRIPGNFLPDFGDSPPPLFRGKREREVFRELRFKRGEKEVSAKGRSIRFRSGQMQGFRRWRNYFWDGTMT
ncbi:hypothetical protein CEXT_606011 [Caerostris extrusa]|uniref:Uncharacterized protein n=1 Tax=Caerostris extrusa TaxID=172846 RepID=A0AAV4PV20_CAEEX|nr:hypothetical protein CEXT_606011 [Caerostris extrusa]